MSKDNITDGIDPETDTDQGNKHTIKRGRGFPKGKPNYPSKIEQWQSNDKEAFYTWLADVKPRVKQGNRYEVWTPTPEQRKLITAIFARDGD